jgi:hypothetical protein
MLRYKLDPTKMTELVSIRIMPSLYNPEEALSIPGG